MTNPFIVYLQKKNRYYLKVYILSIVLILPITLYLNSKALVYMNFIIIGITGILWCIGSEEYENEDNKQ